jgi:hypothetical protein
VNAGTADAGRAAGCAATPAGDANRAGAAAVIGAPLGQRAAADTATSGISAVPTRPARP